MTKFTFSKSHFHKIHIFQTSNSREFLDKKLVFAPVCIWVFLGKKVNRTLKIAFVLIKFGVRNMRCDNDGSLVSPVSALERAQRVVGLWYRLANDWLLTQGRTVDQHYLEGRHQPPTPQSTPPSRQLRFIPKNKFITMKLVSILLAKLTVKAFKAELSSSARRK